MKKTGLSVEEIKEKLKHYCSYQDRCHAEVEEKMREFFLIEEARDEILLYLLRENYLNEERFTKSYIRGKFYQKQWGKKKIIFHLKQKKIPEKLILTCLDEICPDDYSEILLKLYRQYYATAKGMSHFDKRNKTIKYLISKGYDWNDILLAEESLQEPRNIE